MLLAQIRRRNVSYLISRRRTGKLTRTTDNGLRRGQDKVAEIARKRDTLGFAGRVVHCVEDLAKLVDRISDR